MRAIHFTLGDYLAAHGLTPTALLEATRGRVTARAIDALTGGQAQRLDLPTLGVVVTALEELTGKPVTPSDLIEVTTLPTDDPEARAWLDSDLSRLGEFEPYDFGGRDPMTLGQPVRLEPDGGVIIG